MQFTKNRTFRHEYFTIFSTWTWMQQVLEADATVFRYEALWNFN